MRRFIAIAEKELELYYRHVALYGDPNDRDPKSVLDNRKKSKGAISNVGLKKNTISLTTRESSEGCLAADYFDQELAEYED